MSESEKKMTDIKDRLRRNLWEQEENEKQQEEDAKLGVLFLPELFYPEDVVFLLQEIYELEAENKRLQKDNERMMRLYYQPQAQEVMHELVELQRESEQLREELRVTRMERDHAWEN